MKGIIVEGVWDSYDDGYRWTGHMLGYLPYEIVEEMLAQDFAFVNDREFYRGAEQALKDWGGSQ
jgi:hypothetical protein